MKTWRVEWAECPTAYHPSRALFVEAATAKDAWAIAKDHIEHTYGLGNVAPIRSIHERLEPPPGRIVEEQR